MKIELDSIPKPKGLEQQPSKAKVPKELEGVKPQKEPEKVKLNLSDHWNRFWGGLRQGYTDLMAVVRSLGTLKWILILSIILAVIVGIIIFFA